MQSLFKLLHKKIIFSVPYLLFILCRYLNKLISYEISITRKDMNIYAFRQEIGFRYNPSYNIFYIDILYYYISTMYFVQITQCKKFILRIKIKSNKLNAKMFNRLKNIFLTVKNYWIPSKIILWMWQQKKNYLHFLTHTHTHTHTHIYIYIYSYTYSYIYIKQECNFLYFLAKYFIYRPTYFSLTSFQLF